MNRQSQLWTYFRLIKLKRLFKNGLSLDPSKQLRVRRQLLGAQDDGHTKTSRII